MFRRGYSEVKFPEGMTLEEWELRTEKAYDHEMKQWARRSVANKFRVQGFIAGIASCVLLSIFM